MCPLLDVRVNDWGGLQRLGLVNMAWVADAAYKAISENIQYPFNGLKAWSWNAILVVVIAGIVAPWRGWWCESVTIDLRWPSDKPQLPDVYSGTITLTGTSRAAMLSWRSTSVCVKPNPGVVMDRDVVFITKLLISCHCRGKIGPPWWQIQYQASSKWSRWPWVGR